MSGGQSVQVVHFSSAFYTGEIAGLDACARVLSGSKWKVFPRHPSLDNSALDRLTNASYQIVIEGTSYRERLSPHRKLRDLEEVIDSSIAT